MPLITFFSIGKWLVPPKPPKPKTIAQKIQDSLPHQFSLMYIRNNKQFLFFLFFFIILVNVVLFVARAYYFKDFATLTGSTPNPFYMMSRANGRTLLYNSMFIVVLVLRNTITALRTLGLASILPLDNNIYLHKVVGYIIFFQAWFHTIMHLCNFGRLRFYNHFFIERGNEFKKFFSHQHPAGPCEICPAHQQVLGGLWP